MDDVVSLVRADRDQPWTWALDAGLLLGIVMWFALQVTVDPRPELLAVYSALLVGTIVHRIFSLMDDAGA